MEESIKKEIEEKGYAEIEREKKEQLIQLFKEMLDYKNKKYNNDWNFDEWLEQINMHYHYFVYDIRHTLDILRNNLYMEDEPRNVDDVEKILGLIELYEELKKNYKQYANFYVDINLEEGQTLKDLYKLERRKLANLFKEMLDFLNVKYEVKSLEPLDGSMMKNYSYYDDNLDYLKSMIIQNYPYYTDIMIHLDVMMWSVEETYISLIDSMESIYNNLSKNYKNHEQNMEKYKKEQEELEDIEFMDLDEEDY